MRSEDGSRKQSLAITPKRGRPEFRADVGHLQDLRNHGDSPHDPLHDYSAMAEDVAAFIEEHQIEQPTLIGHSM